MVLSYRVDWMALASFHSFFCFVALPFVVWLWCRKMRTRNRELELQIFVLNQRDRSELGNLHGQLVSANPFEFTSEIRSYKELRMQLKTNRSIEDCVFVDV